MRLYCSTCQHECWNGWHVTQIEFISLLLLFFGWILMKRFNLKSIRNSTNANRTTYEYKSRRLPFLRMLYGIEQTRTKPTANLCVIAILLYVRLQTKARHRRFEIIFAFYCSILRCFCDLSFIEFVHLFCPNDDLQSPGTIFFSVFISILLNSHFYCALVIHFVF